MKRILFFLTIVAIFAGCKEKGPAFNESDLIGTWVHVKTVSSDGHTTEDLPSTWVLAADHTETEYFGETNMSGGWKLEGDRIFDPDHPENYVTLTSLDNKHLTISIKQGDNTLTTSFIKMEKILIGEWTVEWIADAQYVTIKEDGTSDWVQAASGFTAGTHKWSINVDEKTGRPVIAYSSSLWYDNETVQSVRDNEIKVTNKGGGPGLYTRGKKVISE